MRASATPAAASILDLLAAAPATTSQDGVGDDFGAVLQQLGGGDGVADDKLPQLPANAEQNQPVANENTSAGAVTAASAVLLASVPDAAQAVTSLGAGSVSSSVPTAAAQMPVASTSASTSPADFAVVSAGVVILAASALPASSVPQQPPVSSANFVSGAVVIPVGGSAVSSADQNTASAVVQSGATVSSAATLQNFSMLSATAPAAMQTAAPSAIPLPPPVSATVSAANSSPQSAASTFAASQTIFNTSGAIVTPISAASVSAALPQSQNTFAISSSPPVSTALPVSAPQIATSADNVLVAQSAFATSAIPLSSSTQSAILQAGSAIPLPPVSSAIVATNSAVLPSTTAASSSATQFVASAQQNLPAKAAIVTVPSGGQVQPLNSGTDAGNTTSKTTSASSSGETDAAVVRLFQSGQLGLNASRKPATASNATVPATSNHQAETSKNSSVSSSGTDPNLPLMAMQMPIPVTPVTSNTPTSATSPDNTVAASMQQPTGAVSQTQQPSISAPTTAKNQTEATPPTAPATEPTATPAATPVHHTPEASAVSASAAPSTRTQATTATNSTTASSPTAQVSNAVVRFATSKDGNQQITLQLTPVELGKVQISLSRNEDGTTSVSIAAQRSDTLALLVNDQSSLHRSLDQAGVATEGRSLNFSLASQNPDSSGNSNDQSQRSNNPSRPFFNTTAYQDETAEPVSASSVSTGLVNITA